MAAVAREASEGPVAVAIAVALARPAPVVAREASEGPVAVGRRGEDARRER